LREFFFVTSADRDVHLQEKVRTDPVIRDAPFNVEILFWDDVVNEIACKPEIYKKYWTGFDQRSAKSPIELQHDLNQLVQQAEEILVQSKEVLNRPSSTILSDNSESRLRVLNGSILVIAEELKRVDSALAGHLDSIPTVPPRSTAESTGLSAVPVSEAVGWLKTVIQILKTTSEKLEQPLAESVSPTEAKGSSLALEILVGPCWHQNQKLTSNSPAWQPPSGAPRGRQKRPGFTVKIQFENASDRKVTVRRLSARVILQDNKYIESSSCQSSSGWPIHVPPDDMVSGVFLFYFPGVSVHTVGMKRHILDVYNMRNKKITTITL